MKKLECGYLYNSSNRRNASLIIRINLRFFYIFKSCKVNCRCQSAGTETEGNGGGVGHIKIL